MTDAARRNALGIGAASVLFFAADGGVFWGDVDRCRFFVLVARGVDVFGVAGGATDLDAFRAFRSALVLRQEYDLLFTFRFLAGVVPGPAIVPNFVGRIGRYRRFNKLCDCAGLYLSHAYCR